MTAWFFAGGEDISMRAAILGGTFNPVHYGHLRVAEEAREALALDRVIFMPTFITPHKPDEQAAQAWARLEMLRIAVSGNPSFSVSDMEMERGGKSYTIDTVRDLKEKEMDLEASLIVGNDSFNDITSWCEYEELLRLTSFIVVHRPGYPVKKPAEALPVELARKFWYDAASGSFMSPFGTWIKYIGTTLLDISSSDIRRRVGEGGSVKYLLPPPVEEFIARHGLYRRPNTG